MISKLKIRNSFQIAADLSQFHSPPPPASASCSFQRWRSSACFLCCFSWCCASQQSVPALLATIYKPFWNTFYVCKMEINDTTMRGSLVILSQHTKVLTPSLVHTDCSANTGKLSRLLWFFLMQRNSNTFRPQSQLHFSHLWWDKSWRQSLKWSLLEEGGKTLPSHPTYPDNILLWDTKNNQVGWKTTHRGGQWNLLWKAES